MFTHFSAIAVHFSDSRNLAGKSVQNGKGTDSFQNKTGFLPSQHGGKTAAKSGNSLVFRHFTPFLLKSTDGPYIEDTTTRRDMK